MLIHRSPQYSCSIIIHKLENYDLVSTVQPAKLAGKPSSEGEQGQVASARCGLGRFCPAPPHWTKMCVRVCVWPKITSWQGGWECWKAAKEFKVMLILEGGAVAYLLDLVFFLLFLWRKVEGIGDTVSWTGGWSSTFPDKRWVEGAEESAAKKMVIWSSARHG